MGCPAAPDPRDAGRDGETDVGPDADPNACPVRGGDESVGMELTVGTGRDGSLEDFRALAPGDPVWVTPGEQGLQHVVVAFRGRGFTPTLPLIEVRMVRAADCNPVGFVRFRFAFRPDPADPSRLAAEALRVTLQDDLDRFEYCTVLDQDAILVVNFDDGDGHRAHRELRVHVAGIDPAARPDIREAWIRSCQPADAGAPEAGAPDAGTRDAGLFDAGEPDAIATDGRPPDAP